MPLLGSSPLAVPDASNLDGAFMQILTLPAGLTGTAPSRVVPGDTYEQVVTAHVTVSCSAAVGNRNLELVWQDANQFNYCVAPASVIQTAGQVVDYSFNTGNAGTYSVSTGSAVITIPALLMLPGHKLFVVLQNIDAGDSVGAVTMSLFRVPTSRPQLALVEPIATPLLA